MECQQEIASKIIEQQAEYILAVKENQKQLYQDIQDEFKFSKNVEVVVDDELDHGRIEARKCSVITDFKFIDNSTKWEKLTSIIRMESTREFKNSNKPIETATRYYISSLNDTAQTFQKT